MASAITARMAALLAPAPSHMLRAFAVAALLMLSGCLAVGRMWERSQLQAYEQDSHARLVAAARWVSERMSAGEVVSVPVLVSLQQVSGFHSMLLRDAVGRQLAGTAGESTSVSVGDSSLVDAVKSGRSVYPMQVPVLNAEGHVRAVLEAEADLMPVAESLARQQRTIWSLAGGGLAAVWLGLAAVMRRTVRQLQPVADAAAALQRGENLKPLDVAGEDALDAVVRAFNHMAYALDERISALRKSESRFHAIADFTYGVEAWFGPSGKLIWVNRSIERVTGFTPLECIVAEDLLTLLVHEKDRRPLLERAQEAQRGGSGAGFEIRLKRRDGRQVWVSLNWQPIYDEQRNFLGLRLSADEIQSRKEAEFKLLDMVSELRREQGLRDYYLNRSEEERLRMEALLDVIKLGVLFVDRDRRVRHANKALKQIWQLPLEESFSGVRDAVMLERTAALRVNETAFMEHVEAVVAGRSASAAHDIELRDGRMISELSTLVPSATPGRFLGRVWIYEDITAERRSAKALLHLAERDPLTNLYNRRRFHEELERFTAEAQRRGSCVGLLLIDLDDFKPINDSFGHQAGDEVLMSFARTLGQVVRRNEMFFRLGGDEFAILVPDAEQPAMIGLARRVIDRTAALEYHFSGQSARVTASIGIALYPSDAGSGRDLVSCADEAMYRSKAAGRNRWSLWRLT